MKGDPVSVVGKLWRATRERPSILPDLLRAATELALARWRFGRSDISQLVEMARLTEKRQPHHPLRDKDRALIDRVRFAIPATGAHLPFRADCLVQAMAAQHWLSRHQISSTLSIGVSTGEQEPFAAHAWLTRDGDVITGGDVSGYHELIGDKPKEAARRA